MKIETALKLFKINNKSTIKDLNVNFRRLAKKYHPDFNKGRETWAHSMMIKLNLAYEMALDFLNTSATIEKKATKKSFPGDFNGAINQVLDGIYTYYQYGLENVHLRKDGIRKMRYRDSIKHIRIGILKLEVLKEGSLNNSERNKLKIFTDFTKAFLQSMFIEKYFIPSSSSYENSAYHYYHNGCLVLDYSIKEAFFGDMLIQIRKGAFYENLDICHKKLMIVITRYYKSDCFYEAVIKLYLLEVFIRVVELFKKMRY